MREAAKYHLGYPPIPLSFFWQNDFPGERGGGVPPSEKNWNIQPFASFNKLMHFAWFAIEFFSAVAKSKITYKWQDVRVGMLATP